MPTLEQKIEAIRRSQDKFIASLEKKYSQEAIKLQKRLFDMVNLEILSKLKIEDGKLTDIKANARILDEFQAVWDDFTRVTWSGTVQNFSTDALKVTGYSETYFKAFDMSAGKIAKALSEAAANVNLLMGLTERGGIKAGGYLDRLLIGGEVKERVLSVLTEGVTVSMDFKELYEKLNTIVQGSDEIDGAMQRYFRTYVYDTFSGIQSAYDYQVAQSAGLEYFVYAGTIIEKSREFCIEHLDQVFHKDIIEQWEAQDWAGKNPDVPFVIARGGYNCRHRLDWIPAELVESMGGEL